MRKKLIEEIEKKIYSIVHETLEKIIGPDFVIDNVKDINLEFVMRLKSYGIGGIILDVDDTIRRDMMKYDIPDMDRNDFYYSYINTYIEKDIKNKEYWKYWNFQISSVIN